MQNFVSDALFRCSNLVEVILDNVAEIGDVENSFSRRRGLRRRIKRFEALQENESEAPRRTASRFVPDRERPKTDRKGRRSSNHKDNNRDSDE